MSDFFQTGVIPTLHRLGEPKLEALEQQLEYFAGQQPVALVLPALYSEFENPVMERILDELGRVRYVKQFVVTMARTDPAQFPEAKMSELYRRA